MSTITSIFANLDQTIMSDDFSNPTKRVASDLLRLVHYPEFDAWINSSTHTTDWWMRVATCFHVYQEYDVVLTELHSKKDFFRALLLHSNLAGYTNFLDALADYNTEVLVSNLERVKPIAFRSLPVRFVDYLSEHKHPYFLRDISEVNFARLNSAIDKRDPQEVEAFGTTWIQVYRLFTEYNPSVAKMWFEHPDIRVRASMFQRVLESGISWIDLVPVLYLEDETDIHCMTDIARKCFADVLHDPTLQTVLSLDSDMMLHRWCSSKISGEAFDQGLELSLSLDPS